MSRRLECYMIVHCINHASFLVSRSLRAFATTHGVKMEPILYSLAVFFIVSHLFRSEYDAVCKIIHCRVYTRYCNETEHDIKKIGCMVFFLSCKPQFKE